MGESNVHGSGLNSEDRLALRDVIFGPSTVRCTRGVEIPPGCCPNICVNTH